MLSEWESQALVIDCPVLRPLVSHVVREGSESRLDLPLLVVIEDRLSTRGRVGKREG